MGRRTRKKVCHAWFTTVSYIGLFRGISITVMVSDGTTYIAIASWNQLSPLAPPASCTAPLSFPTTHSSFRLKVVYTCGPPLLRVQPGFLANLNIVKRRDVTTLGWCTFQNPTQREETEDTLSQAVLAMRSLRSDLAALDLGPGELGPGDE